MQIRELLSLDSLQPIVPVTGETGLERDAKAVVLLEYEGLKQSDPNYYKDDIVVTTLYCVKDRPELLYSLVEKLIRSGAAGMAYKSCHFENLPEDVLLLATNNNFPILRFKGLFLEDVILSISDAMRMRQEFSMYEDHLYKIITGSAEGYGIEQLCARMNPFRQKYMNAVYVHARDLASDWGKNLRDILTLRSSRTVTDGYRILQFRRGFFVLSNYTQEIALEDVGRGVIALFERLGMETEGLCFGVGGLWQRSTDFDCVIRDAFDACLYGILQNRQVASHDELMLYQHVFPMVRDKSSRRMMERTFDRIKTYDQESGSGNLLATLLSFAENNYSFKDTATAMNQHPNTIRYRLKKICELTAGQMDEDHALFMMGEYQKVDALSATIF